MAKEMGLDRAPIEFRKLVFLVPPTEFPYVVKTKASPLPSKAQKKLPVVSSCVSCRGPAYVSVKLLQKKQSSPFFIEAHFSCSLSVLFIRNAMQL